MSINQYLRSYRTYNCRERALMSRGMDVVEDVFNVLWNRRGELLASGAWDDIYLPAKRFLNVMTELNALHMDRSKALEMLVSETDSENV